jgi:DNA mismatch repair protein MutS
LLFSVLAGLSIVMNKIDNAGASPAMAQWFAAKAEQPDALLFFRMGDFYEMFFEDAQAAAAALDIALTARGSHQGQPVAMCGVPVGQAELYLARLIRRGFRVAIVEQMEDPAAAKARGAKGPLARAVVRLVTPGTLTEDALLEGARANYLTGIVAVGDQVGVAWADISTGLFETEACTSATLVAVLGRLDPSEILAAADLALGPFAARRVETARLAMSAPADAGGAGRMLEEAFGIASLEALGVFTPAELRAAALVLAYIRATQMGAMPRLSRPQATGPAGRLEMDAATRASLELVGGRAGEEAGSLLGAVRRTVTAAGARLLAGWIAAPLASLMPLQERQAGWLALRDAGAAEPLRAVLRAAPDMARALGRISAGRAGPRDLAAIGAGLAAAARAAPLLPPGKPLLDQALAALSLAPGLGETLARALSSPAPLRLDDGGTIEAGFDGELDAERRLRDETRQVIAGMQSDFATRYGVAALKIRHHAQLGYVLEAPAGAVDGLRQYPELHLRQGMANGARFTHPELSALDERIEAAASRATAREKLIFDWLVKDILAHAEALAACGQALATLDVLQSAAGLAATGRWCCPELTEDEAYRITAGRHPVVEAALPPAARFIANDTDLSPARRLMLLTGPNMAGKSTYLRQNALCVILAQAGLPVPAEAMRLGLVDRLFSRVGAADDLASGRSTFMVEMIETAAILHQAGPRSFVIVDEIGRGTGTRDGLAIAQAVLESLHGSQRCRTMFATHFHELVGLGEGLRHLAPHTMRVKEYRGEVVFMHEVVAGTAGRSWGVHVARLAGVPEPVTRRADFLLRALERNAPATSALPLFATIEDDVRDSHADLLAALATMDPDAMSPRQALEALYTLRRLMPEAEL